MKSIKFTRHELYQLVWQESLPSLAKKYDTTYHDLRKICLAMEIPLPKAGYWQNLWLGKKVIVEPLPDSSLAQQECTLSLLEDGETRTVKVKPEKILKEKDEQTSDVSLRVLGRLTKPETLVEAARKDLEKKSPWNFGHDAGMVSCSKDLLDITVSPRNVGRAIRFMDALIKIIKGRGNSILIESGKTYAVIEGEKVKIVFREKRKRVEVPGKYSSFEYKPTGILCFKMVIFYKDTEWTDGKILLENQLYSIVSVMEAKAKEHKQKMLRWKIESEKEEEERRVIRQQKERRIKELEAFKRLLDEAQEWRQVDILRKYIDKVEAKVLEKGPASEDLKTWLTWAREMADKYDPLNNEYKPYFQ
jgi:hypothetical protein